MAKNIVVPHLGDSVIEATVIKWTKSEGDAVKLGETVVELETEKANFEVAAETAGVLVSIDRKAEEDVKVGDVLGSIDASSRGRDAADGKGGAEEKTEEEPAAKPAGETREKEPPPRATPVARNVAQQRGVDLSRVETIRKQDHEGGRGKARRVGRSRGGGRGGRRAACARVS